MSRSPVAIAVWGLLLIVLAAIMWFVFWADALSFVLPSLATVGTWAIAVWAIRWNERRHSIERVTALSPSTALAAIGFSLAVWGAEVGPWLIAMGAGLFVVGVLGLVGEARTR